MSGPKEKQAMTKSAFIKEVHDAEAMLYHVAKSILNSAAIKREKHCQTIPVKY